MFQRIIDFCTFCQKHFRSFDRFKFTLKDEDNAYFNYIIMIDVFYIDSSSVFQIVDKETFFQVAR